MELGCFIAGVTISAQGYDTAEKVETIIQPLKDFLSCIFFASIGNIYIMLIILLLEHVILKFYDGCFNK